ncbi:hypothetical protein ACSNOI_44385 [Actinomadura kijaniata]|uniref:hypothetical protein n=1 Tax=Actinomadura kijaniata TaxID=46161 RepID=UPI003F1DFFFF
MSLIQLLGLILAISLSGNAAFLVGWGATRWVPLPQAIGWAAATAAALIGLFITAVGVYQ